MAQRGVKILKNRKITKNGITFFVKKIDKLSVIVRNAEKAYVKHEGIPQAFEIILGKIAKH